MDWKTKLAYVAGSIDDELLLRNEYLAAENRILRAQIKGRSRLTDVERRTLAEIGKKLGRKILAEVAVRHDRDRPGLAQKTGCEEVRRIEEPPASRPTEDRQRSRTARCAPREGEPLLGATIELPTLLETSGTR